LAKAGKIVRAFSNAKPREYTAYFRASTLRQAAEDHRRPQKKIRTLAERQ